MPRPEINDYTFYKIVNINDCNFCYVGSTCNVKQRRNKHKIDCNNPKGLLYNNKLYTTIREHGGWDEFKMIEIEHREQLTLIQSRQIEEEHRKELKANLNMIRCFQTKEEFKEMNKLYSNKWKQNNKEHISNYNKDYFEKNKELLNMKFVCECGSIVVKSNTSRHNKSQKHIKYLG